jgi:hypothetical protein
MVIVASGEPGTPLFCCAAAELAIAALAATATPN